MQQRRKMGRGAHLFLSQQSLGKRKEREIRKREGETRHSGKHDDRMSKTRLNLLQAPNTFNEFTQVIEHQVVSTRKEYHLLLSNKKTNLPGLQQNNRTNTSLRGSQY